ncbi:MAG: hypothetical protein WCT14_16040 [Treponemataceae bacterium]
MKTERERFPQPKARTSERSVFTSAAPVTTEYAATRQKVRDVCLVLRPRRVPVYAPAHADDG